MQISTKFLGCVVFITMVANKFTSRSWLFGSSNQINERVIADCTVKYAASNDFLSLMCRPDRLGLMCVPFCELAP